MTIDHRIAAGGITFNDNAVLLVRYNDSSIGTYLAAPGGALEDNENIIQAVIRETKEETNVIVQPQRVVIIEDLVYKQYKMSKVWMICKFIQGEIRKTSESEKEGIIEAAWFTRNQLDGEKVYPEQLLNIDWEKLISDNWQVVCPASRKVNR
jgi:ADP-ribose pyrophosphatase YjhB (NUDIX family)